nr:MAG TPA: hypothetical protein [Caudoviricetes sp.]
MTLVGQRSDARHLRKKAASDRDCCTGYHTRLIEFQAVIVEDILGVVRVHLGKFRNSQGFVGFKCLYSEHDVAGAIG